jgi:outer membrane lipoprotein SlyB
MERAMSSSTDDDVLDRVRVREVAGVFREREPLEAAVADLTLAGFDRADVDLMATSAAIEQKLGGLYIAAEDLADVPRAPRRAFVAREDEVIPTAGAAGILSFIGAAVGAFSVVASGGAIAVAAAAAALGGATTGGIGALALARYLEKERAKELEALLATGGMIVWVRVRSPEREEQAQQILQRHGGEAVRVHEIEIEKRQEDLPLSSLRPDPWLGDEPLAQP